MPMLDAALAFSLTMLVVATAVTQIVRLMHTAAGLRAGGLEKMLNEYFETEIQPVVKRETERLSKKLAAGVSNKLNAAASAFGKDSLVRDVHAANLVEVSTEEMTELLKRSPLGTALLTELGEEARNIFGELGRRYEAVCAKFTKSFREKSRQWATAVSLVLALTVNIDSIHIAGSYIRNENLRGSVIAQMDTALANYSARAAAIADSGGKYYKEELMKSIAECRSELGFLAGMGFPVGWTYFPHAGFYKARSADYEKRNNIGGWIMWVLGIILTAVLAGLGAPFWYDTVTGISRFVERTRTDKKPAS